MVQLLDTERLLELAGDHPVMGASLREKSESLRRQIEDVPIDGSEPSVQLFFSGDPVMSSTGIEAAFLGKVLNPFQQLVSAEFSQRVYGKVGNRGQIKDEGASRLFLTALPKGSFGVLLARMEKEPGPETHLLAESLVHVTNLIAASVQSDEAFAIELEGKTPRAVQALTDFLKVLNDAGAAVKIESGSMQVLLAEASIRAGLKRASETTVDEKLIEVRGKLKGVLLESWRFDIVDEIGKIYSGVLDDQLDESDAGYFVSEFFNKDCTATLKEGKVKFKNGRERTTYTLLSILP